MKKTLKFQPKCDKKTILKSRPIFNRFLDDLGLPNLTILKKDFIHFGFFDLLLTKIVSKIYYLKNFVYFLLEKNLKLRRVRNLLRPI